MSRRIVIVAVCLAAIAIGVIVLKPTPEPSYHGVSLSDWLAGSLGDADGGPSQEERVAAVHHIGTNGIPTLLQMVRATDSHIKLRFADLMRKQHFVFVRFTPADEKNDYAAYGFTLLGADASNAVPTLLKIYEHNYSKSSKRAAAKSLGSIGVPARVAIPIFIRDMRNSNSAVRLIATEALSTYRIESTSTIPAFEKALTDDPDSWVRSAAAEALGQFRESSATDISKLVAALKDADPSVRRSAASALGRLGKEPHLVVPALISSLNDSYALVQEQIINALGEIGAEPETVVPLLISKVRDKSTFVRISAVTALGAFAQQSQAAAQVLVETITDEDSDTSIAAMTALRKIRPDMDVALPKLIDCLRRRNPRTRLCAVDTLGFFGKDARPAAAALRELASDRYGNVRRAAKTALDQIESETNTPALPK